MSIVKLLTLLLFTWWIQC